MSKQDAIDQNVLPDIVRLSAEYPKGKLVYDKEHNTKLLQIFTEDSILKESYVFDEYGEMYQYLFYHTLRNFVLFTLIYDEGKIVDQCGIPLQVWEFGDDANNDKFIEAWIVLSKPRNCISSFTLFEIDMKGHWLTKVRHSMTSYGIAYQFNKRKYGLNQKFCVVSEIKSNDSINNYLRRDTVNFMYRDLFRKRK